MEQRTEEWLKARLGHATGSRFKDVMAKLKNGSPAKVRQDYALELAVERLTDSFDQRYVTAAMQWGIDQEANAMEEYMARKNVWVDAVGFLRHPDIAAGCSPDGMIGTDGGIEIKCPFGRTVQVTTWLEGMPEEHIPQVQGAMWITGRAWWDFASFDPRLPENLRLFVKRVPRDEAYIAQLEAEVRSFLGEVEAITNKLAEASK